MIYITYFIYLHIAASPPHKHSIRQLDGEDKQVFTKNTKQNIYPHTRTPTHTHIHTPSRRMGPMFRTKQMWAIEERPVVILKNLFPSNCTQTLNTQHTQHTRHDTKRQHNTTQLIRHTHHTWHEYTTHKTPPKKIYPGFPGQTPRTNPQTNLS